MTQTPYDANVDIRDSVDYKNVMKEYNLGPNGGILTASNLFATRFDQVVSLCEKRSKELDNVFVDTPGQIEIFTWSASGAIVTESFASAFPTVVLYVLDTWRVEPAELHEQHVTSGVHPVQNRASPDRGVQQNRRRQTRPATHGWRLLLLRHAALDDAPTFASDLSRSLSLVLDAFYKGLRVAGVSAMTGEGMETLFDVIARARKEYMDEYLRPICAPGAGARRGGGGAATRNDENCAARHRGASARLGFGDGRLERHARVARGGGRRVKEWRQ